MRRQLVMGLPGSGKTTFLAALWALLHAPDATTCMRLARLPDDWSHFNKLAELWLRGQELPRTKLQTERWVELDLATAGNGVGTRFALPDLSGENFEAQWRDRRCGTDYVHAASEADSLLLFIHATDIRRPLSLTTMRFAASAIGLARAFDDRGDWDPTSNEGPSEPSTTSSWNPDRSPTQVVLVDLLQVLLRQPFGPKRRRLAVVLSAWDRVIGKVPFKPSRYLSAEFPLLDQFLVSNSDMYEVKVFGISPQGADKADAAFSSRVGLLPQDRIIVDDGQRQGYDLTGPLAWASGDG